jgi:DNA primase
MKRKINCTQAKRISIIDFLENNNIYPYKIRNNDYWFHSPFRNEKAPSFKVDRAKNVWYDFGIGEGGNLIDLGERMYNCTIKELLEILNNSTFLFHQHSFSSEESSKFRNNSIKIKEAKNITNHNLISYVKSRGISINLANNFLKEVHFSLNNNFYYALGFGNDSGGFELKNKNFVSTISPKDITTFNYYQHTLSIFEGFFDFLSFLELYNSKKPKHDTIILNSLSFINKILPKLNHYKTINSYLDNDQAGKKALMQISREHKKVQDMSRIIYPNHKDFNDYLKSIKR